MSDDLFAPEPEQSGVPTWVWIVGGVFVFLLICTLGVCAGLSLLGDSVGPIFEEIQGTLEAESPPPAPTATVAEVEATPTVAPTAVQPTLPPVAAEPAFHAEFDQLAGWPDGEITDPADEELVGAVLGIQDGVYDFQAYAPETLFWVTAGEDFGNGVYEVEATAVEGPLDNGFGMLFMVDNATDDFYVFEISSDGFIWIGYCSSACEGANAFVNGGWFESESIREGLNTTNHLRVVVEDGNMAFFVNGQAVGRATDTRLVSGDVGMFVETQSRGDVRVHFDNFKYSPLR